VVAHSQVQPVPRLSVCSWWHEVTKSFTEAESHACNTIHTNTESAHRCDGCSAPSCPSCPGVVSPWVLTPSPPGSSDPFPLQPPFLLPTRRQHTRSLEKPGLIRRPNRGLSQASVLTHIHLSGHFCPFSPLYSYACSSLIHTDPSLSLPFILSLNISLHISTIPLKHC